MKHAALRKIALNAQLELLNSPPPTICPSCDREYLLHGLCYTCGYGMSNDNLIDDEELNSILFDSSDLLDIDFYEGCHYS